MVPVVGMLAVMFSIVTQLVPSVDPSTRRALNALVPFPFIQKLNCDAAAPESWLVNTRSPVASKFSAGEAAPKLPAVV